MKRRHLLAPALLTGLGLPAHASEPLRVVASFSILADWLRVIGGDAVRVEALVGPDADAHVFTPRPSDARKLAQAELVAVIGLGFEGWMARLIKASGSRAPVVVASQGLPTRKATPNAHHHHHGSDQDPHFWHDLRLVPLALQRLRDGLSAARPAEAAGFAARCAAYEAQVLALHQHTLAQLAPVPEAQRRVLTGHDAFGYFGAAYGVSFMAPRGLNTDSDPSAAQVAALIQRIRRDRVRAVFIENASDPRLVQRIAAEAGAQVGGRLYADALSAPGTEADTFVKLFAHNAGAIANALQRKPA